MSEMNTSEAYNTGYEAAKQGESLADNPYLKGTYDADQWAAGFADAK
jgi:hypothetical protein